MAEYPRWLHKDWKPTDKQGPGHHEPALSMLAHDAEEAKLLESKGFTDAPGKHEAKAEPVKVEAKHEAHKGKAHKE